MSVTVFEFYAACVGLTMVLAYSKIAHVAKEAMHVDHLGFFSCPQCIGFWVGAVAGYSCGYQLWATLASGFASSVLSLFTASVISWLGRGE